MSPRNTAYVLLAFLLTCWASELSARRWTDATGKFTTEASLVDVVAGVVKLKKPDGTVIAIPLKQLSESDRTYVKSLGTPIIVVAGATVNSDGPLIELLETKREELEKEWSGFPRELVNEGRRYVFLDDEGIMINMYGQGFMAVNMIVKFNRSEAETELVAKSPCPGTVMFGEFEVNRDTSFKAIRKRMTDLELADGETVTLAKDTVGLARGNSAVMIQRVPNQDTIWIVTIMPTPDYFGKKLGIGK